jgi:hypothetical protein
LTIGQVYAILRHQGHTARQQQEMKMTITKGQKVLIKPKAYPGQIYEGTVLRKTKYGWSVHVMLNGMGFRETYGESEIIAIVA